MGPWGIAAIALIGATTTDGGRKFLRTAAIIKAGLIVKDKSSTVLGELKEQVADVVAEVKAEASEEAAETTHNGKKTKAAAAVKEEA
jgi:hypothetical protein